MEVLRKAFSQKLDQALTEFVGSIDADEFLIEADIRGSIAHATMLADGGLLTAAQADNIVGGLQAILDLYKAGDFKLNPAFEDVHMNVEKKLQELIGEDALRLHTARSRNDQVALDIRLYALGCIEANLNDVNELVETIKVVAAENIDAILPGYTHLQRAQPVHFAHALLAFVEMLERDKARLKDLTKRVAVSPLGAGAQAGTGLNIDPALSAKLLGMPSHFANSIDAVSDRDFVAEYLFVAAMCGVHLSQMAETLIIYASKEFGFISFSDAVTTASSLMPQKKNPDPVELIRGKCGSMVGELVNVLVTLKGLPLGYNRDLQETKPPLIKTAKEIGNCLRVMTVVLQCLSVNKEVTLKAAGDAEMISTDLVEYLVNKGIPFRKAHEDVSALVAHARESGQTLNELSLSACQSFNQAFEDDLFQLFDPKGSLQAKTSPGSTGTAKVKEALAKAAKI